MAIPNVIIGFIAIWIILYGLIFFTYVPPKNDGAQEGQSAEIVQQMDISQPSPFYSEYCISMLSQIDSKKFVNSAAVVIVARNEKKETLIKTVP